MSKKTRRFEIQIETHEVRIIRFGTKPEDASLPVHDTGETGDAGAKPGSKYKAVLSDRLTGLRQDQEKQNEE